MQKMLEFIGKVDLLECYLQVTQSAAIFLLSAEDTTVTNQRQTSGNS